MGVKVKKCPICCEELPSEDAVCPQCGKIHLYFKQGVGIYDRNTKKMVVNQETAFYVTDYFFAYDDKNKGSSRALQSGVIAGLSHASLVGWLAGAAITTGMEVAQNIHRDSKQAKKIVSTATCYDWRMIESLTYPMESIKSLIPQKVGAGIDVKLTDGTEFTILVNGFGKEPAKELYQKMDELHRNIIQRSPASQIGYPNQQVSSFADDRFTERPVQQMAAPVYSETPHTSAPVYAKASHTSAPVFFKCSYCGITQMREGNFCSYCGKPAPAQEPDQVEKPTVSNSKNICPSCGNAQESGSKFCFKCGYKFEAERMQIRFCSDCGAKVSGEMLFCMECGSKLR